MGSLIDQYEHQKAKKKEEKDARNNAFSPREKLEKLISRLPELNQLTLMYLAKYLQLFSRPEVTSVTKMDASNLATVFAPNCLKCPSQDPIVILENTRKEMAFVKSLIVNLDTSSVDGLI